MAPFGIADRKSDLASPVKHLGVPSAHAQGMLHEPRRLWVVTGLVERPRRRFIRLDVVSAFQFCEGQGSRVIKAPLAIRVKVGEKHPVHALAELILPGHRLDPVVVGSRGRAMAAGRMEIAE